MRGIVPVGLFVLVAVLACNSDKKKDDTPAASASVASALLSAAPSASAAAKPSPCTVEAAVTVDTGVRADAGLTLVVLPDGRLALGYATGTGEGEPKVAIVDASGKASFTEVDQQHLKTSEKKQDKARRNILRVTPLGFKAGSMTMRVGVDLLDTNADKSTSLRCGPADLAPFVDNTPGSDGNILDCRTFSDGQKEWVLASIISLADAAQGGKQPMRWFVDYQAGKQPLNDVILDEKPYDAKKLEKPEGYIYQVPVGIGVHDTGYVFAARQEGSLVLARRSATLDKAGDAVRFGFGASAPTMPALTALGHQAAVFVGLYQKTDVYAATFAIEAKPAKPEKLTLDDPNPPTAGDRNSMTASYMPKGDIFLAFADGLPTAKKARMTVLGGDLKSRVPVFELTTEPNVSELRVVATGDDKAMITYLAGGEIKTALVTCK